MRIYMLVVALLMALPQCVMSQSQSAEEKARIAEQRRIVEQLEKELEEDEKRLNSIKKDKSTAQQRVRSITKQINSRNQLLNRTEREINHIEGNITRNDSLITSTERQIAYERERYAEMVREAYRNYRQNNYALYLLASTNFVDAARRIANIRAMAVLREERLHRMDSLAKSIEEQQASLTERRRTLDDVQRKAEAQRKKGHWIRHPEQRNIFNGKTIECSECHEKYTVQYVEDELFCRHCGADMREPEDIPMEYFESGGR